MVRNMLLAMPAEVEVVYFGDPEQPVRTQGDRVVAAGAMSYQPSLGDKVKMLAQMAMPRLARLPIHSFFAPNRASSTALELLRRFPRSRPVLQTLPASTGGETIAGLLARLDRVVVTSDWGRQGLIEAGVTADRVARVYPGVVPPDAVPQPPVAERRTVLFAGDLDKDVADRLIDVAAAMKKSPDWTLAIATRPKGEGHAAAKARLDETLAKDVASGRVEFLGEVSDMNELFDRAAIQLYLATHARKKVDIPFVLLEGMARGVPVAVVDALPVGELLTVAKEHDLQVGLPLSRDDFRDSADALPALLQDTTRLQTMGEQARQLIGKRFSAQTMATEYRRHYEELS